MENADYAICCSVASAAKKSQLVLKLRCLSIVVLNR
jgi:hypothetical protein